LKNEISLASAPRMLAEGKTLQGLVGEDVVMIHLRPSEAGAGGRLWAAGKHSAELTVRFP